ncbi:MAG TPA: glycosyltransferase family 1 protein [Armatimonadota bacterium]|jgi:glycosyltransferase involved in cell wall biosynthesis
MHIAVNALLVYGAFSGVQHTIVHQLRALLDCAAIHRYTIITLTDVDIREIIGPTRQPYAVLRAPLQSGQRLQRICWEQLSLPAALTAEGVDLLYSPGYLTSLCWRGPSVVYVHDTIALSHPSLCSTSNAVNYRLLLPPSARHATRVAVPSQASAQDVARYCRVPDARIAIIPHGVQTAPPLSPDALTAARQRLGVTAPYLLAVSTIEPKKNFANLIRWFDAWKDAGIPHELVILGKWGWKSGDVARAWRSSRNQAQIHLPGYVAQLELPAVMAAADALLVPSRYEGFGLPALEGMAVGTPVIVSDQGALPETVGDAGLVLPLAHDGWLTEIPRVLQDQERLASLRADGPVWAARHTWERAATLLEQVFADALSAP